jgi:integrase
MQFLEAKQFYKYCTDVEKAPDKRIVFDEDMKRLYARFYEDYEKQPEYIPTYAVHLATLTGFRAGELAGLDWKSVTDSYIIIDKSEKYNRITKEYFIDKTKNGKNRIFPITDEIRELLDAVRKVEMQNGYMCEWVFANENGRIHAPIISSCSKNKCRQIGISEKGIHAYRRTVNSKMRCNGVSATVAASLLGHTAEVNEQYYTFDVSTLQEKAEIVSNIGKRAI